MKKYTKEAELTEGYIWKDDVVIGTTPEYFARELADETNVQKAIDFLEEHGIQVKTEYGYYRPTYDVLKDIGNAISRA